MATLRSIKTNESDAMAPVDPRDKVHSLLESPPLGIAELPSAFDSIVAKPKPAEACACQWDARTDEMSWSNQLRSLLGIDHQDVPHRLDAFLQLVHADDRDFIEKDIRASLSGVPFEREILFRASHGRLLRMRVSGVPVSNCSGKVVSIVAICNRAYADGELERLSQQLLRARDEERRSIARDLHESAGQTLAALKMILGRLREALPAGNDRSHGLLASALELTGDAVREVRTISYLMHPPMLDEAGLGSALRWYAKGFGERSGISVQIDIPEDFGRFSRETETTVFRIVQEALTNVHRYSGSRTATIRISGDADFICAEVRDDGCGLPVPNSLTAWDPPRGVGIVGMRERVKQLDGRFEIESAPGRGTTVRVVLPVDARESLLG